MGKASPLIGWLSCKSMRGESLFLSPWRSSAASSSGTADLVYGISFATAMLGGRVLMALTSAPPMVTTAGWPLVWILSAMQPGPTASAAPLPTVRPALGLVVPSPPVARGRHEGIGLGKKGGG